MLDTKQFSVAMSVYKNDNPEHFKIALDSIINQTVHPSEIIMVVDGPVPDGLINILEEYKSQYEFLKPIYLKKNNGLGNALCIAVDACSYELVARMDSDDISAPDRFEKQLRHFERNDSLSLLGGYISEFTDDKYRTAGMRVVPTSDKEVRDGLKKRCPFNHMTVMFKKSDVLRAGNYKDWFRNEDYYLWIRMYEAGCHFGNLPDVLVNVRVGSDMYKRRGGIKYFKSEMAIQKYMLEKKIIGFCRYTFNVGIRFILQVLLPNSIRGYVFRKFARKRLNGAVEYNIKNNQEKEERYACQAGNG